MDNGWRQARITDRTEPSSARDEWSAVVRRRSGTEHAMKGRDQAEVLVIDDDTTLLLLLRQSLEKAGYTVLTATNGLAGLQQMYEHHPDLIVLDVMMPRMDGWETVSRIREMSQVPVIMLTAKDEEA